MRCKYALAFIQDTKLSILYEFPHEFIKMQFHLTLQVYNNIIWIILVKYSIEHFRSFVRILLKQIEIIRQKQLLPEPPHT
jgi:hypothetical protein